jgi:protein-disulfide isomerase
LSAGGGRHQARHCHIHGFKLARLKFGPFSGALQEQAVILTRRAFSLSATALVVAAFAGGGYWWLNRRTGTTTVETGPPQFTKAPPLGDVVLGATDSPVTIIEYASMTCPHCADFHKTVYPKIKAEYIDTRKIRFIFREFPLDAKAAAGSMLARCIGKDDPNKYHAVIDILFATQNDWAVEGTSTQLLRIAKQAGMSEETFNACLSNQSMLDALKQGVDQAVNEFKVDSTPTFFVNGTKLKGGATFEDFKKLIDPNLKS